MSFRHILTPTDFSEPADAALGHAVRMAERFEATLHLLHVVGELDADRYGITDGGEGTTTLEDRIRAEAEHRLHDLGPEASTFEIRTEVVKQLNRNVADAVEEYAGHNGIDFIVMGTHGRRRLERFMLGSVANTLVRAAPCPIMTVRSGETGGPPAQKPEPYQRVLAPIDFSEHSQRALRVAKEVAARYEARLDLLFVAEERVVPQFSDIGLPELSVVEMGPEIVENAEAALKELNENVGGPSVDTSVDVRKGDVSQEIVDFAEGVGTDLIVMATRGVTGLTRFVLGSNTERIIRVAPSPVLTVPPQNGREQD